MKKIFLLVGMFALTSILTLHAQVTIGLNQPPDSSAVLDIQSKGNLGMLLPRVILSDTLLAYPLLSNVPGMMVYNTKASDNGKVVEGVYINDGHRWWQANTGEGGASPWLISGSTTRSTSNTDNIYQMGQVGIGTSAAVDSTAILDVVATNKGVLFPRVALSGIKDETTIPGPTKGLLVFNTGDGGLTYTGYVFWDGAEWVSLTSGSLSPGTIGSITCNSVTITPSIYSNGTPYDGTMTVPYTGSNGGMYPEQTIGPVNGLTATLAAGNFTPGAGTLVYSITGTPTVTTPETTTFSLNIGGQTCDAVVGAGDGIAPGDLVFYQTTGMPGNVGSNGADGNDSVSWMSYYAKDLPVVGGKLRLDGYFDSSVGGPGTVSFNPRIVNISGDNVKIWFSAMTTVDHFNMANVVLAPNSWVNLDNGIYSTWGLNSISSTPSNTSVNTSATSGSYGKGLGNNVTGSNNGEIETLDLSVDSKWYRIYYFMVVDNNDVANATAANCTRRCFLSIQRLY